MNYFIKIQELLGEDDKTPLNHRTFNSLIHYILPFPLFPTQINLFFFSSFYFPTSLVLHTMNFHHNIGWGAPHLLKCHQYQLCRWWFQRGNNIASFPSPSTASHFLTRKRALCSHTGTDKKHYRAKKGLKAEWTSFNSCRKIRFLRLTLKKAVPGEILGEAGGGRNHRVWGGFLVPDRIQTTFIHQVFIL